MPPDFLLPQAMMTSFFVGFVFFGEFIKVDASNHSNRSILTVIFRIALVANRVL